MPRSTQQTPAPSRSGMTAAEPAEIQRLVEDLDGMLSRLRLGAIREQLDGREALINAGSVSEAHVRGATLPSLPQKEHF